ncbi:MAG: PKD domain-containing protein [Flavihumibacter sp.]
MSANSCNLVTRSLILWIGVFFFLPQAGIAQHTKITLSAPVGVVKGYLEHLPDDYAANPGKTYPLLLFLHGLTETGNGTATDLEKLANVAGTPLQITQGKFPSSFTVNGESFKYIVICPQFSRPVPITTPEELQQFIDYIKPLYRIDASRIYLTGCSSGGGVIWNYCGASTANAASIAAVSVMAGSSVPSTDRCNNMASQNLPVWAFHNLGDPSVPSSYTIDYVNGINAYQPAPNPLARKTTPNFNSHAVWYTSYSLTYKEQFEDGSMYNVYEWMLRYKRSSTTPPVNQLPVAAAGADKTITLPVSTVTVDGSASYDPDGSITAYAWTQTAGPATATIVQPAQATTAIQALTTPGNYTFRLTVTDNKGGTNSDLVTITVQPAAVVPPTANAGPDVTITLPGNNTTLNGSGSFDPDGTITAYLWTQVSGPRTANILNPASATTVVNTMTWQGVYVFDLMVTDNSGATGHDQVQVTVLPAPNLPPVANAGPNQSITLPSSTVNLSGNGTDPNSDPLTFAWTQVAGPQTATIQSPNAAATTVSSLSVAGTYTFRLRVTDNHGSYSDDEVNIAVQAKPNERPHANAGANQQITLPVSQVTVSGSGSTDDAGISTYAWKQTAGPVTAHIANAGAVTTGISGLTTAGTYRFQLKVTDAGNLSDSAVVVITVLPAANTAPSVHAGANQSITLPVSSITLTGTASDAEGDSFTLLWTQVSGPATAGIASAQALTTNVTGLQVAGTYVFQLKATDSKNASATSQVTVTVAPASAGNLPPVANAGSDITLVRPQSTTTLDGSLSYDPENRITGYNWTKISSPVGVRMYDTWKNKATVEGLTALGVYSFVLRVTDNVGQTSYDTVRVTVVDANTPPNQPPVSDAGSDASITLPLSSYTLRGTNSHDPDGVINSFSWRQVSGPAAASLGTPQSSSCFVNGLTQAGVYVFELTVTDDKGAATKDSVQLTILPAPLLKNPVARAGDDIRIALTTASITLNGTGSFDPDGTIKAYSWSKVSGPAVRMYDTWKATCRVENVSATGTYVFVLTVTDNDNLTGTDTVVVTVIAGNRNEVAPPADSLAALQPGENTAVTGTAMRVFPNPVTSSVSVQLTSTQRYPGRLKIFNMQGLVLREEKFNKNTDRLMIQVPAGGLPAGQYLLQVETSPGKFVTEKIFKLK